MGPWLRAGRRFEYTIAVLTITSYLVFGFILTRSEPSDIRWIAWILLATFVFPFGFVALLLGRWRRKQTSTAQTAVRVTSRPRSSTYLVLAIVTAISATEQARINLEKHFFAANAADIVFWNFGALALLIAITELSQWRKRLLARRG
jgi:hypothetical protein